MQLLVVGHAYIIDTNRKFWSIFAKKFTNSIDLIIPEIWSSNLKSHIPYVKNDSIDNNFSNIYPVNVYLKGNGSLFFFNPLKTLKILKKKYDVIYLYQETWALSTALFILLKQFSTNSKTKLILCVHQNIKKEQLRFLHPYERFISKFIDCFFYCSEEVKDVLRWKKITTRCEYFPLPFDEDKYSNDNHILTRETLRIGFLGRIAKDKGIEILLNACDQLYKKNVNFKLIMGGNGPLVPTIKEKPYVEYLGLIPHNEAHLFYKKIDLFILPSLTLPNWKEQFGRVIVESFASGVPVIGSNSGSIPEVLGKVDWNWTYNENSSDELLSLILKFKPYLQSTEGKEKLKQSIMLNFSNFSINSVQHNVKKIFDSML